ncbi:thioredoxin-like protein [Hyaloscypha variabilis]
MTLKIHIYPGAISTQRVINICHELGLDNTFVLVDFKASAQNSPECLSLQPFGNVPLLVDDDFFVYESRAICKYEDVQKYALFEQACSIETEYFDGPVAGICYERFFKPCGTLIKALGFAEAFATFPRLNEWFDELSRRKSWIKTKL